MRNPFSGISRELQLGTALGLLSLITLVVTLGDPGMAWDEGITISREEKVREWFGWLARPRPPVTREQLFLEPVLEHYWPFSREEPDGHPPFYALVGNAGWLIGQSWLPPLEAHRLGPALLYSLTLGVMLVFVSRRLGLLAGLVGAGSWALMPRVFAHAHLASYDMPLACLWLLAALAFWKSWEGFGCSWRRGSAWSAVFATLLALAASTKFTGWFIPLPLGAWSLGVGVAALRRDGPRAVGRLLPAALAAAPLVVCAPEVLRMMAEVASAERSLTAVEGENSQQRATRAARGYRGHHSSRLPGWVLLLPAAAWFGVVGWNWRAGASAATPAPGGPVESVPAGSLPWIWSAALALAPAMTIAINPSWWHDPLRGVAIFLWSNLSRRSTTWIPTMFFGSVYEFSLPWYNTIAWVFLTVPPGIFLLTVIGVAAAVRGGGGERLPAGRRSGAGAPPAAATGAPSLPRFLLLHAATLLVIRALPSAPGHDGERQLLGSFPFLACLAGWGAETLRGWLTRAAGRIGGWLAGAAAAFAMLGAAASLWHYHPLQLSYYTELVGGLRGAERLGLEPTYYWDALDRETLAWLNASSAPGEKAMFCSVPYSLHYLRTWGLLRVPFLPEGMDAGRWRWYVLQNRPGMFLARPQDRWLVEHGEPAYTRSLHGVPLIWVFPFQDYEKAIWATRGEGRSGGSR